ncbi:MAG TPA: amidophosphoribosyltransferase [Candidatus Krumholzibacteria bacterium]|nr:amidophosphoribosyltransferase [Candidatus Krumholzibacteria bacterium]HPD72686.1 amidophosphoribosyltransferase [Candidatus Krumholzibacteria bacterium]HRY40382.1 amidophosphoribosyltransferase [Candidatus Krumholzibacteria bacterium]
MSEPRHWREECGVVGIAGVQGAAELASMALHALQHRGQESAGITVSDGHLITTHKAMGLVADVFDETTVKSLPGTFAIGHVRYSTSGSSNLINAQPIQVASHRGAISLAHNGNLVNAPQLRRTMEQEGSIFSTTSDSEVILHLLARDRAESIPDALQNVLPRLDGAYSLVLLSGDTLIAARDPLGFRPLCLGRFQDSYVVASESCAFDIIGARYLREVEAGEIVVIGRGELASRRIARAERERRCVFEHVYFSRPDSTIFGTSVERTRRRSGEILGREAPADADLVTAVPDSSNTAALGYARATGIPFEMALIRNHYIGRTFISPAQQVRDMSVRIKFNPVAEVLTGRRVVVVDDSIVRGTTMRKLVKLLRQAGAEQVHLRIASPPITNPCFYGIDTPVRKELIASSHTVEEIAAYLRVDSLCYLSLAGLLEATGEGERYCNACFTGDYPVPFESEPDKAVFDRHAAGAELILKPKPGGSPGGPGA